MACRCHTVVHCSSVFFSMQMGVQIYVVLHPSPSQLHVALSQVAHTVASIYTPCLSSSKDGYDDAIHGINHNPVDAYTVSTG